MKLAKILPAAALAVAIVAVPATAQAARMPVQPTSTIWVTPGK